MLVGEFVHRATAVIREVVTSGNPQEILFHRNEQEYATVVPTELWREARRALEEKRAREGATA